MSFYGKIYAQMDNVFDSFYFDNVEKNSTFYTGKLADDFILGAESFNDKLIMKAGNSWIQFVKIKNPIQGELGDAVEIFHGAPMTGEDHQGNVSKVITSIKAGNQYNTLIADNSTLLTQKEKDTLKGYRSEGKLLFFGDTLTISTPKFDKAGHITGYDASSYILSEVPRLEEFLGMSNDIIELQEVVGVEGYPEECAEGTLGFRVFTLEDAFESVRETAQTADELAKQAAESAAAAAESAANAEASAKTAEELANRVYESLEQYQDEVNEDLITIDKKYTSLVKAVGVTDNVQIESVKPDLETPDLFTWMLEQDSRLDQHDIDLADLEAQLTADKEELQQNIDNLRADHDADVQALTEAHNADKAELQQNINILTTTHNEDKAELQQNINDLSSLHSTDKAELQQQINDLSSIHSVDKTSLEASILALGVEHESDVTAINESIAKNRQEVDSSLNTAVANLETSIGALRTDMNTADSALENAILTLAETVNENQNNLIDIIGEIPQSATDVASWVKGEIAIIDARAELQETTNEEFNGRITTNQTNLSSLLGEVERMSELFGSSIELLTEQVGILQQTIVALEARIAVLEGSNDDPTEPDDNNPGEAENPEDDPSIE